MDKNTNNWVSGQTFPIGYFTTCCVIPSLSLRDRIYFHWMPERGVFFISTFFRTLLLKICFFLWMGSMKPVLLKNTDRPTISHSGDTNQKYYIPVIKTRLFRIVRHSCSKTLDNFLVRWKLILVWPELIWFCTAQGRNFYHYYHYY